MNLAFSQEQEALRSQLRRLLGGGPGAARRVMDSGQSHDASLWKQLADIGMCAAAIEEGQGGLGLGALELCVGAEEIGRTLAPVPFSSSVLYATEALKLVRGAVAEAWLAKLASSSAVGTVAFVEGTGTWDAPPTARVVRGQLFGRKTPVADPAADFAVVSAVADEDGSGYGWWLVELRAQGVRSEALATIDVLRPHACLDFNGIAAQRLGEPGQGARLASQVLDVAAVLTAFEQLGGAQAQLEACVEYAKTRRAFGNFIGVNQAVKHRLADMYTRIELARGHCYYGAWALASGAPELTVAAAGARLAATAAYSFAAEEAIEMQGGIGFTWESDCHLYYRRARLLALVLGNRSRWSDRLIAGLQQRIAA